MAGRAGTGGLHLPQNGIGNPPYTAGAVTGRTSFVCASIFGATPAAGLTGDQFINLYGFFDSLDDFIKGEFYRSEEHTSELQSLMRISYAVFCLKKTKITYKNNTYRTI